MDRTYCTVHISDLATTFVGFNAEQYTAAWNDIKNERYNTRMALVDELENELAVVRQELLTLKDDRTFWQKLCCIKTETSKRISELNNKVCCILDDIFTLKANTQMTRSELFPKLMQFFEAEGFNTSDFGCQVQVWTKVHK